MRYLYPLLVLGWLACAGARAQTVHILGFLNTDPGDQAMLGNKKTIAELQKLAQAMRSQGKLTVKEQFVNYPKLSAASIAQTLAALQTGPDDAVVCYLASHGWNNGRIPTPMIAYNKGNEALAENSVNLQTVSELLKTKAVRLRIVIGESCNVLARGKRGEEAPLTYTIRPEALQRLFRQASGEILVWSARVGQKSVTSTATGGLFAQAFLGSLRNEMAKAAGQAADWNQLLTRASAATAHEASQDGYTQEPERISTVRYVSLSGTLTEQLMVAEEQPSHFKGFELAINTNKGRDNLLFRQGDTLKLFVKASQPCYVRFIYLLEDGTKTLLLDNYVIRERELNQFVAVQGGPFVCSPPFGKEYLLAFASTTPFPPLTTQRVGGYVFITDNLRTTITASRKFTPGTRGFVNAGNAAQDPPAEVTVEDKLVVLTRGGEDGEPRR